MPEERRLDAVWRAVLPRSIDGEAERQGGTYVGTHVCTRVDTPVDMHVGTATL
ncbi:hypothetical protein GPA10_38515 [Streptomyces sp. p1417]|uniref:Uncharacterized protein n=1 Tax=Streptomyces typhae TaxID=2681492 RepID=A0A6L6XB49_9ACTN|nr:hypothetical protein [Streptomyces typhae]MVO90489.1 hypothetical protein [Streptomyces typhae]